MYDIQYEEFHEDSTVGPRPKVWIIDQRGKKCAKDRVGAVPPSNLPRGESK